MLELFLRFLGGLQCQNDAVAGEVSETELITKKGLYRFIKSAMGKVRFPGVYQRVLGYVAT